MNIAENFNDASFVSRFTNKISGKDSHITKDKKMSPSAFMYPQDEKAVSLVHIDGLNETQIWNIGDNCVYKTALSKPKARGDIKVEAIKALHLKNLFIERDDDGFQRHVNAYCDIEKNIFAIQLSMLCSIVLRKNIL
jgi:hypothetical protein